ncbi:MAG: glycosyltransferase family 4 protein [Bryobacteraceae bacterium]
MSLPTAIGCRVLLIGPAAPPYGGVALQTALLAGALKEEGVTITFIPFNPPLPFRLRVLEHVRGVRTILRLALYGSRLLRGLANVEIVDVQACSWWYFFLVVIPAVVAGRIARKRVVMKYHGGEADRFFACFGRLLRPVFRMADAVTAPSGFLKEVIHRRIGVPVKIVPNIIDLAAFRYRERLVVRPRMLVTRHLEKLYDVEMVIRAFREIQIRYSDASLWIAGSGSEEARLRGLVATWDLRNVSFLGHVAHSDLPPLYDRCDLLLNGSRSDNFPGSLIEAAAAGLVVISTGAGGIPYVFQDGINALLVAPGDWMALSAAVRRVLEEPGLAPQLTRAAFQLGESCAWSHVRPLLFTVYGMLSAETADGRPGGPHIERLPSAERRSVAPLRAC